MDIEADVKTRRLYVRHKDHVGWLIFVFGVQELKSWFGWGHEDPLVPNERRCVI